MNSNWEILPKNLLRWGDCLKRGTWTVCQFKVGLAKKRGGGVFEERGRGGVDTPMHTMRSTHKNTHHPVYLKGHS